MQIWPWPGDGKRNFNSRRVGRRRSCPGIGNPDRSGVLPPAEPDACTHHTRDGENSQRLEPTRAAPGMQQRHRGAASPMKRGLRGNRAPRPQQGGIVRRGHRVRSDRRSRAAWREARGCGRRRQTAGGHRGGLRGSALAGSRCPLRGSCRRRPFRREIHGLAALDAKPHVIFQGRSAANANDHPDSFASSGWRRTQQSS